MSDELDRNSNSKNEEEQVPEAKFTGLLPDLNDDDRISSSRRLEFDKVVERSVERYKHADHLLLVYFPQRAEPFLFPDKDTILVGRSSSQPVDLDTNAFHGRELGVSRHHAEIIYENDNYHIRDLKSTNGTWLNNTRLEPMQKYPITAGDQLRLGHCLMILFTQ